MEEKQLNHFSHEEHPLILSELRKKIGDVIYQLAPVCYGCQNQILDSTAYCCFSCRFFLHRWCAELPRQIMHPMHSEHPLFLLRNPPYPFHICSCNACGRTDWKFFTYHCSMCEFDLHPVCADLDREIKLDCHDHPLIHLRRRATFYCNACDKVAEDSSCLCTVCPFWIHQTCASLPTTVKHKHHNHPLSLAYSLPSEYRNFEKQCSVCDQKVHPSGWIYYCGRCRYFVHVTCVEKDEEQQSEDIDNSASGEQDQNVLKLPSSNLAQESIASLLLKKDETMGSSNDPSKVNIPEKISVDSHKEHPLVILSGKVQNLDEMRSSSSSSNDHHEEAKESSVICDRCIEPICPSDDSDHYYYYACLECGYFLHLTCSNLPAELQTPKHSDHPLSLTYNSSKVGYFRCDACCRRTNGAYYRCEPCYLSICIKCASATMITSHVKHEGHKKHLLSSSYHTLGEHYMETRSTISRVEPPRCAACGAGEGLLFRCEDCSFRLCYGCALLPPATTQSWDEHPLLLVYPPYSDHPEEFYCVLCETEINPNHWMYHCRECDYSLHPRCVPQVELLRRVKFGRSLSVSNHPHPLTHVAEARYKSFCGRCNRSLDWKEAFECDSCRFYLCPFCARCPW